jgi:hypothetical protein
MPLYYAGTELVLPLGFEPRSSPHLEASPRYKLGALTVKLWEQKLGAGSRIRTDGIHFGKVTFYP